MAGSKERERRRARERYEQQREIRRARQRAIRKRLGIGLAVLCVLGLAGGLSAALAGGGSPAPKALKKVTPTASASASATASTVAEPATHCTYTTKGVAAAAKKVSLPPSSPDYKDAFTATITTNLGPVTINLANSAATCTVNSFVHLAEAGYFDSTQCHRLVDTTGLYVLQCGDPYAKASEKLTCATTGTNLPGTGGPGYEFADENLTSLTTSSSGAATYKAGTVAMANSGAGTNGSQFFLVYKNSTLAPSYTPFGTITSGLDILQKVANAGTSCLTSKTSPGDGAPKQKVVIESVTIKQT